MLIVRHDVFVAATPQAFGGGSTHHSYKVRYSPLRRDLRHGAGRSGWLIGWLDIPAWSILPMVLHIGRISTARLSQDRIVTVVGLLISLVELPFSGNHDSHPPQQQQ